MATSPTSASPVLVTIPSSTTTVDLPLAQAQEPQSVAQSSMAATKEELVEGLTKLQRSLQVLQLDCDKLMDLLEGTTRSSNSLSLGAPLGTVQEEMSRSTQAKNTASTGISKSDIARRRTPRFISRKPFWAIKVLEPSGLVSVESLDDIEMRDSVRELLKVDKIPEASSAEKSVLSPLLSGDDVVIQVRGTRLQSFCAYPIIEALEGATADLQVIAIVNRLDSRSTKSFLRSLQEHVDKMNLRDIRVQVVAENQIQDLEVSALDVSAMANVFVCTPETMAKFRMTNVLRPKDIAVMVVYEAEYVLRNTSNTQIVASALSGFDNCQAILACHDGTKEIMRALDTLGLKGNSATFSMDYTFLHENLHYYYAEEGALDENEICLTHTILERAVELSKKYLVVVICMDTQEVDAIIGYLNNRANIATVSTFDSQKFTNGILVTTNIVTGIFQNKIAEVKLILNISGVKIYPEKYFSIVVTKVSSPKALNGVQSFASKGVWGELLGMGDFYYELGIQIIDVCLSTRPLNGGLMELSEVKRKVERMRGVRETSNKSREAKSKWTISLSKDTSMEISEDDLLRSVKTLAPLGSGFQILQIGDKKMVSSVPRELNRDQSVILGLVQKTNGHINIDIVAKMLGWESRRTITALDTLLEDSLMWIDMQTEPHEYWVPGFIEREVEGDESEDNDVYASVHTTNTATLAI
ncbi:hypothetical protein BGW38_006281 [Lunasporangiospora selenospora]|uniref:Uncharacterized protein n=1 Tax=Lunasporangiospora selenospora TaxID=979761 RepID=A0A9P6G2T9_9FUNG|nr:hypothetical protein BGW38_006281 [Lunasporangiospora selenospora]